MTHQELVDYIVNELRNGTKEAEINNALVASGWHEEDIKENLNAAHIKMGQPAMSNPHEPKAKREFLKRHAKAIVIMCITLLLLASGAFAAYKFLPLSPDRMLQQAALKMNDVYSFDFSGRITADVNANQNILDLQARLPEIFNLNPDNRVAGASTSLQFALDFDGSIDRQDSKHPKSELNFDITAGIFTVGMKMKLVNDIVYLRVDNVPKFTEEITKYSNTWIKIDPVALSEKYGLGLNLNASTASLTEGQKNQINELFRTTRFYNSIKRLDDDMIDGKGMYHYSIVLDKAALKNYLQEVEKINKSAGGLETSDLDALDSMQLKNSEIWIGKSDRMLHRVQTEISQSASNDSIPSGSVHLLLNFSNYNNISKISAPSDSKNIDDVIQDIMQIEQVRSRDTARLSSIRIIMKALENYYNDYNKYPKSLNNLKPKYLSAIPTSPVTPDGNCTEQNNNFVYKQTSVGKDYELVFCLGTNTGGYKAGPHTARMKGIDGDILTFD
ncbi:MAG: hypothetical protein KW804_01290 [Candidatus Doudnabacteria bacterium]|nr:hypothetical protein [Candidatus Doudnabacteria bacterium]